MQTPSCSGNFGLQLMSYRQCSLALGTYVFVASGHGWWMRELADDTAGIFLENEKVPKAIAKVSENISALRLITFEMNYSFSGRHKISVKRAVPLRIRLQKAVIVSDI